MKRILAISMVAVIAGAAMIAAAQGTGKPAAVVQEWNTATKATNFEKMAQMTHPDALAEFRDILLPVMISFRQSLAADTTGAMNGENGTDGLKEQLANIDSVPPEEFYVEAMNVLTALVPDLGESLRAMESEVLGTVAEGDTLAHVVRRTKVTYQGNQLSSDTDVVSLKQSPEGWQVLLTGGIRGLAQGIRTAYDRQG